MHNPPDIAYRQAKGCLLRRIAIGFLQTFQFTHTLATNNYTSFHVWLLARKASHFRLICQSRAPLCLQKHLRKFVLRFESTRPVVAFLRPFPKVRVNQLPEESTCFRIIHRRIVSRRLPKVAELPLTLKVCLVLPSSP